MNGEARRRPCRDGSETDPDERSFHDRNEVMAANRPGEGEAGAAAPGAGCTLEVLFTALEGPLLSYALRFSKDREMAEDLVQEAFLRLQGRREEVREPRSWLYRTVHNLALNELRSGGRVVRLGGASEDDGCAGIEDEAVDGQPLPDEQLARWEGIGLVRIGLQSLDDRSREVVRLKFQENLSYKEIGVRTGLTTGYVGYLLHHALKSLASELSKAGLLP